MDPGPEREPSVPGEALVTCHCSLLVPATVWFDSYLWAGMETGTIMKISVPAEVPAPGVEVWKGGEVTLVPGAGLPEISSKPESTESFPW